MAQLDKCLNVFDYCTIQLILTGYYSEPGIKFWDYDTAYINQLPFNAEVFICNKYSIESELLREFYEY